MQKEKIVTIEGEDYVIKRYNVEQKCEIQDKLMREKDRSSPSLDTQLTIFKYGLAKAPFEVTPENVKAMDGAVADLLLVAILRHNTLPLKLISPYVSPLEGELSTVTPPK